KLLSYPEIEADRLGVADMQIAVGLGRKAGHHLGGAAGGEIGRDDVANEIAPAFDCLIRFDRAHLNPLHSLSALMWPIRSSKPRPTTGARHLPSSRRLCPTV